MVLAGLGLTKCKDTIIGNAFMRGVSGGWSAVAQGCDTLRKQMGWDGDAWACQGRQAGMLKLSTGHARRWRAQACEHRS